MKYLLEQAVLRLPAIRHLGAKRAVLRMRVRALLGPLAGYSARSRLDRLRRDASRLLRLSPIHVAGDRTSYLDADASARLADLFRIARGAQLAGKDGKFVLRRFCLCCNETMPMRVDGERRLAGPGGTRIPNWREQLVCSGCGMNNRQRLVAKLVQQAAIASDGPRIYLMEQVTPIFEWVRRLPQTDVHGSEYLGPGHEGGQRVHGLRHEDVMRLSYPDASFDLIVSNDVLEHIPDPGHALRECCRVLKPGGTVLATFPFHVGLDTTVARARLVEGRIEHLHPPQYHGNPVSSEGSLVFHDFGWDLLDAMKAAGFSSAAAEVYGSDDFGHLGPGLLVFRLVKPAGGAAA